MYHRMYFWVNRPKSIGASYRSSSIQIGAMTKCEQYHQRKLINQLNKTELAVCPSSIIFALFYTNEIHVRSLEPRALAMDVKFLIGTTLI